MRFAAALLHLRAMSELDGLLDLMGVSPSNADASSEADLQEIVDLMGPGVSPEADPPGSPASPGCSALAEIVDMALAKPPPKKFTNRSWEHAQHARKCRHDQIVEARRAARSPERKDLALQLVARTMYRRIPGLQTLLRQLGGKTVNFADPTTRALAMTHAAFSPSVKGDQHVRRDQAVAFLALSRSALAQQQVWFDRVFRPAPAAGGSPANSAFALAEVRVFTWQWDETSQRVRPMLLNRLPSERISHKKVSTQIMMQAGLLSTFEVRDGCFALVSSEEWFCRGLMLAETNGDFLLEGLSRGMPCFFDDEEELLRLCAGGSPVIVSLCCDRASPNFRACAWLWKQMEKPALRRLILPHLEPCSLHGVQLVNCRPTGGRAVIAAMSTLACLMKQWRYCDGLREEILYQVRKRLRVVHAPRPARCSARAESLARLLLGAHSDDWLYRQSRTGEWYRSQLLNDIEALCTAVDFGSADSEEFTHYCYCQEGDAAHASGVSLGDPMLLKQGRVCG